MRNWPVRPPVMVSHCVKCHLVVLVESSNPSMKGYPSDGVGVSAIEMSSMYHPSLTVLPLEVNRQRIRTSLPPAQGVRSILTSFQVDWLPVQYPAMVQPEPPELTSTRQ